MALDTLVLGPFTFDGFAVPRVLPAGGKQALKLHKLAGGDRVADTMGPDDRDRCFQGIIYADDAVDQALTLDALRNQGAPLPYSNGVEARIVIVAEFTFDVEKFNVVHYQITLTPVDNPNGTSGASAASASSDDLVNSDLGAAQDMASDNAASAASTPLPPERPAGIGINSNSTPLTTPSGSGGIGSA